MNFGFIRERGLYGNAIPHRGAREKGQNTWVIFISSLFYVRNMGTQFMCQRPAGIFGLDTVELLGEHAYCELTTCFLKYFNDKIYGYFSACS